MSALFLSNGNLHHWFAFLHAHKVVVEEIDVESCLQNATEDLSPAVEVIYEVSVNPIGN